MRTYSVTETVIREISEEQALAVVRESRADAINPAFPLGSHVRVVAHPIANLVGVAGVVTLVKPVAIGCNYRVSALFEGCVRDFDDIHESKLAPLEREQLAA